MSPRFNLDVIYQAGEEEHVLCLAFWRKLGIGLGHEAVKTGSGKEARKCELEEMCMEEKSSLFISGFPQDTVLLLRHRGYGFQGVRHVDILLQQEPICKHTNVGNSQTADLAELFLGNSMTVVWQPTVELPPLT